MIFTKKIYKFFRKWPQKILEMWFVHFKKNYVKKHNTYYTFFKNKAIGNFEVQMQYLPMQFIQNRFFFLCKPMTNIIKFNIPVLSCQQINLLPNWANLLKVMVSNCTYSSNYVCCFYFITHVQRERVGCSLFRN